MLTRIQQVEKLRREIANLDRKIDARKAELVTAQTGLMDGEINDPELISLRELRMKCRRELRKLERSR